MAPAVMLVDDLSAAGGLASASLQSYGARRDAALALLATGCGLDAAREIERFAWCATTLRKQSGALDGLLETLPDVFELVLAYRGHASPRMGYLTQGRPQESLPKALGGLLAGGVTIHRAQGGTAEQAVQLARLFATAFPEPAALGTFSATAQAMVLGFGPRAAGLDLKAYFNTRLYPHGSHRDRVLALARLAGVADDGLAARAYDALCDDPGASFAGVGVDLEPGATQRIKLYVRTPLDHAEAVARRLVETLVGDPFPAAPWESLAKEILADEVELGVALRGGEPASVKATLFVAPSKPEQGRAAVAAFVAAAGYATDLLEQTCNALAPAGLAVHRHRQPIHAVGIELPHSAGKKLNLYLQPVL